MGEKDSYKPEPFVSALRAPESRPCRADLLLTLQNFVLAVLPFIQSSLNFKFSVSSRDVRTHCIVQYVYAQILTYTVYIRDLLSL